MFNIYYIVIFADDTRQIENSDVSNECIKKIHDIGKETRSQDCEKLSQQHTQVDKGANTSAFTT